MHKQRLIVTHHAPDLDAIASAWLLVKFDPQKYYDAKVAFVDPGATITLQQAEKYGCQLHEVTHVDTGLGKFDHHRPEQNDPNICATTIVYDYLCELHPEIRNNKALHTLVNYVNEIDHFKEIHWPDPANPRYCLMIQELIKGHQFTDPHDNESQLYFGFKCLDYALAMLDEYHGALESIASKGRIFETSVGECLAIETSNHAIMKVAQRQGYVMVITKNVDKGNVNIKVRPDVAITLEKLHQVVLEKDPGASWFYHNSGKMLINGSRKKRNQTPSKLSIDQLIEITTSLNL